MVSKMPQKRIQIFFIGILSKLGFTQSKKDECLWSYRKNDKYIHYLFHVDDIMVVSNSDSLRDIFLFALKQRLKIRDEGEISMFLGM